MKRWARIKTKGEGGRLKHAKYVIKRSPLTIIGAFFIVLIISMAVFAPFIANNPYKLSMRDRLQPPSIEHLMGTDSLGRDVFSRVVWGARISLKIAFVVVSIAATVGTLLGLISGYSGGLLDMIIMRIVDAFLSVPPFLLAMVATASLGPSIVNVMLALSITWWTWYARLVRGEVLKLKNMEFILAAKALGVPYPRIILRHLLPNCMHVVIVQISVQLGYAILTAAGLSFLGLGAQPPAPSWGLMVSEGRQYLPDYWWMSTFPGIAISILVLGFILIGDGLRDVFEME